MFKKNLYLVSGILTGIVFVDSIFNSNSTTIFGSPWIFSIGMLMLTISSLGGYFKIKKSEKK
jgi:hypothetical protein